VSEIKAQKSVWLTNAKQAFDQSTTFMDNNYRKQWENNLRHFQSKHHTGSKYSKASYRYRSKVFRPKTRAATRSSEASASVAFFANQDVVGIEPQNPNDEFQQASADILKELISYRLDKTIPWFQICLGGFQDAQVMGVVASYQAWEYEETKDGKILKDEPNIEIIPIENIRISPSAKWTDPVNSSPYLIRLIPMYVLDVKLKMKQVDSKTGKPKWKHLDDGELKSASPTRFDSTQMTRDGEREDKYDNDSTLSDYDVVWVHQNFMRVDGNQDVVFYTLGTEQLLTDPVPIEEMYFHGERPIVIGCSVIETHRLFSSGVTQLGENIQKEINEVANQRLDNIKLVLNKRYFARRGSQVDLKSLVRNVAGSVTLVSDVNADVKAVEFQDVTGSSYNEQDRLNVDYDDVVGTFSTSTVQSNRQLNETVGGMNMMKGASGSLQEYIIRTFSETWVEPVLRQLMKLEQKYETDMVVLSLAAEKAQIFQKYGIDEITDKLLDQELTTRVNVGMGATDPMTKITNFMLGIRTINEAMQNDPQGKFDIREIAKEVFGRIGYKDGARFFLEKLEGQKEDPEKMQMSEMMQQMQMAIEELQAQLQEKQSEQNTKIELERMKEVGRNRRMGAQLETDMVMKEMDLMNPVAGET
jgi:hypothetical protein